MGVGPAYPTLHVRGGTPKDVLCREGALVRRLADKSVEHGVFRVLAYARQGAGDQGHGKQRGEGQHGDPEAPFVLLVMRAHVLGGLCPAAICLVVLREERLLVCLLGGELILLGSEVDGLLWLVAAWHGVGSG